MYGFAAASDFPPVFRPEALDFAKKLCYIRLTASIVPAKNKAGRAVPIRFLSEETKLLFDFAANGIRSGKGSGTHTGSLHHTKIPICTRSLHIRRLSSGGENGTPKRAHRLFSDCFHGVCKWKSAVILHHREKHKSGRKSGQHPLTKNPGGRLRSPSKKTPHQEAA